MSTFTHVGKEEQPFLNSRTAQLAFQQGSGFVDHMWFGGAFKGYTAARVAIAVSDTVDGNYKFVRSFRPLGKESRNIGEFVDDGSAFLIFQSRPSEGFYIGQLSHDSMRYDGLYYVIGSHLTGWNTNPNVYSTAVSLGGPWSEMKNIAPPETNTYNSQSGMLIQVTGSKGTVVVYAGERWNPTSLWDSRYIWLPVEIVQGKFQLKAPCPWSINVRAGVASEACRDRRTAGN